MNPEQAVYKLVDELGFQNDIIKEVNSVDGKVTVVLDTEMYQDKPWLAGKLVNIFQAFVDRLPKIVEYNFVAETKEPKKKRNQDGLELTNKDVISPSNIKRDMIGPLADKEPDNKLTIYRNISDQSDVFVIEISANTEESKERFTKIMKQIGVSEKDIEEFWTSELCGGEGVMNIKASIKVKSTTTPAELRLLNTGVSRLGQHAMESGMADAAVIYWGVKHLVKKIMGDEEEKLHVR